MAHAVLSDLALTAVRVILFTRCAQVVVTNVFIDDLAFVIYGLIEETCEHLPVLMGGVFDYRRWCRMLCVKERV